MTMKSQAPMIAMMYIAANNNNNSQREEQLNSVLEHSDTNNLQTQPVVLQQHSIGST